MNWLGFIVFVVAANVYIWNGKDRFNKKEWIALFIKFVAVLATIFILIFLAVSLKRIFPAITKETIKEIVIFLPPSLMTLLLLKFFVVMLCAIFENIMRFHKSYNTAENYLKLSVIVNKYGPKLQVAAKCLASIGSVLMFYGIWFGANV